MKSRFKRVNKHVRYMWDSTLRKNHASNRSALKRDATKEVDREMAEYREWVEPIPLSSHQLEQQEQLLGKIFGMFAVLLVASVALAGDSILTISGNKVYRTEGTETVLVGEFDHIVVIPSGDDSPPIPPTPPEPKPPIPEPPKPPSSIQEQARKAAAELNDPTGATVVYKAFEAVSNLIKNGTIPATPEGVDKAVTLVFFGTPDKKTKGLLDRVNPAWTGFFRSVVLPNYGQQVLQGKLKTKAEFVAFFAQLGDGVKASIQTDAVIDLDDQLAFLQLLLELLRLLDGLFGGASNG